jgi:hypothetical protein
MPSREIHLRLDEQLLAEIDSERGLIPRNAYLAQVIKQRQRDLTPFALHHIDGDPTNNDPANLEVVEIREHR